MARAWQADLDADLVDSWARFKADGRGRRAIDHDREFARKHLVSASGVSKRRGVLTLFMTDRKGEAKS